MKIWGGYSSKVHDFQFLEIQQERIESYLNGAGIFRDRHFRSFGQIVENVIFYTPFIKLKSTTDPDGINIVVLIKDQII